MTKTDQAPPNYQPRTTTLVLTPSQLHTMRGAIRVTRLMAEVWPAPALDVALAELSGGQEQRAPGEPDASVRDRILMLLDTALAQDADDTDLPVPDTERPLPGPSGSADVSAPAPVAPEAA